MSLDEQEYIINPVSGKVIKKGTRAYNLLLREGKIAPIEEAGTKGKNKKVLYKIKDDETEEQIEEKKQELDKDLENEDQHAVKGRGVHKNKLVSRHKPPPTNKVVKSTKKMMEQKENFEIDDEELTELEKRILILLESSDDESEVEE